MYTAKRDVEVMPDCQNTVKRDVKVMPDCQNSAKRTRHICQDRPSSRGAWGQQWQFEVKAQDVRKFEQ